MFRICPVRVNPVTSCRVAYTAPNKQRHGHSLRYKAGQSMNGEVEGIWKERTWPNRDCHYICLEKLKKPTKYATQNSRDSNPEPLYYEYSLLSCKARSKCNNQCKIVMKGPTW